MYTSENSFFKYLRKKLGVDKPFALPVCPTDPDDETWEDWDVRAKREKPVAYFLTETLPDWIDNVDKFLFDWYRNLRYWFRNRFVSRLHYLDTGLERGKYYDLDTRILHGLFNELKKFVEGELAWASCRWDEEAFKKYKVPFYRRWLGWTSREAGLDHLKWAMNLKYGENDGVTSEHELYGKSTYQADNARKQWILYHWWENYQQMTDSHDLWHEFNDEMRNKYDTRFLDMCRKDWTQEECDHADKLFEIARQVEEAQEKEIQDMLHMLIDIRRSLWT
jgi:hypothetical protein